MAFIYLKTVRLEVTDVRMNFMSFNHLSGVRNDIFNCGFCERPFTRGELVHLAFIKGRTNRVICDVCAGIATGNGAAKHPKAPVEKKET